MAFAILGVGAIAFLVQPRSLTVSIPSLATSPTTNSEVEPIKKAIVHIAGAIEHPGVYEVTPSIRVMEALKLAGGTLPDANLDGVNLAAKVKDGQRILVPVRKPDRVKPNKSKERVPSTYIEAQVPVPQGYPVAINSASKEALMTIPGIGTTVAQRILNTRAGHLFDSIEDLKKIKGISAKKLEKIRPFITL